MKNLNRLFLQLFFLTGFLVSSTSQCFCQKQDSVANSYYFSYPEKIIVRLYLSRKFAPFTISSNTKEDLNYKTNSKLNLGAGFTYRIATLNFAYGFNFLNTDKARGDTKGLDLQLHIYPKKFVVDVIGSFLKGYYLEPKALNGLGLNDYYKRPDISRNIVGLSVFRVANSNKFSYRAALNQKDWQTRSAGSILYGAETYYGIVNADSAFVPVKGNSIYAQAGVDKINFLSIGPGFGYAYTLVFDKHMFVTGSAIAIVSANISSEHNNGAKSSKVKVIPGGNYKAAIGYNGSEWSMSATLLGNALYAASAASYKEYFVPTGSVNLIVAKRIGVKKSKQLSQ